MSGDDVLHEFLVESYENLDRLDQDLVELEKNPDSKEMLSSIFRTIHTIKGTSGFFGFDKLGGLTHVGESLLSKMRDGELRINDAIASALLRMVDAVREMLASIESSHDEGEGDYSAIAAELARLLNAETVAAPPPVAVAPVAAAPKPSLGGDDVLHEFLVESYENLDRLDQDLVELEKNPDSKEMLSSIFRTIHTIKGTSGFFGFDKLGGLTHVGENLLSKMRDGELRIDDAIASALLRMVDAVREMLASIESSHDEGEGDYSAISTELVRLLTAEPGAAPTPVVVAPVAAAAPTPVATAPAAAAAPTPVVAAPTPTPATPAPKAKPAKAAAHEGGEATGGGASAAESSIRVDTLILDKLMNLAGELVLARNELAQLSNAMQDPLFASACARLSLITAEMQEGVMRTRMQPIGNLLTKLPRVVRDLAVSCGKQVAIELEGKETELDRTVLEAIKDPLTHIIRNSVDHGIEAPAVRLAAGKPAQGVLRVRAFHEGGHVNLEITDDGGGINPARVKAKALERGLISEADGERMSERELVNLIFAPGFSTAEKVTSVSGRGVGMDVVKTNVQKIGGTIDVESRPGHGTCLRIKIPLTLAIIPALTISCANERYAIPQLSVRELVRLDRDDAGAIESLHGVPVHRLRGQLLPLVDLDRVLTVQGSPTAAINVVVLEAEGRRFGLIVDAIKDTEEIVVKPLDRQMQSAGPFSGATILGDGRVALILDVRAVAQRAHVFGERSEAPAKPVAAPPAADERDQQTLLVLRVGDGRAALPLDQVTRLEEIEAGAIELAGGREMVQCRGRILPLVRVAQTLALEPADAAPERLQVIVHTDASGASFGLVVDRILDVVRQPVELQAGARIAGVLGTAVVQKRVTEMLDVRGLLRSSGFQEQR